MNAKRLSALLLGIMLCFAFTVPAAASPASDLKEAVQEMLEQTADNPQAGSGLIWIGSARSEAQTWDEVVAMLFGLYEIGTMTVEPGAYTWAELLAELNDMGVYAIPYRRDGSQIKEGEYSTTLIEAGQHFVLLQLGTDELLGLGDIVVAGSPGSAPTSSPLPSISSMQHEGIALVNELRASVGVSSLQENEVLCAAAQIRANEIAVSGVFSHTRPNGESCSTVITGFTAFGENIAMTSSGTASSIPKEMMELWTNSPGHYSNMVNPDFYQMGIAYARASNGAWYGVQLFSGRDNVQLSGTPAPSPSAPAPSPSASAPSQTEEQWPYPSETSRLMICVYDNELYMAGLSLAEPLTIQQILDDFVIPPGTSVDFREEQVAAAGGMNGYPRTGDLIRLVSSEDHFLIVNDVVMGDVLGTGKMTIAQVIRLARAVTGVEPLEGAYLLAGSFDGTGNLTIADLVAEAKMLTSL